MEPLLTIGIPAFNSEKYIIKAIQSIYDQNFSNFEIIAVDDCSSDRTFDKLKEISLLDKRIKIIRHSINKGICYTRNEIIGLSSGKYFVWLDSDDFFIPDSFNSILRLLESCPSFNKIVICNAFLQKEKTSKKDRLFSKREKFKRLGFEDLIYAVAIGDVIPSYPWIFVGNTALFKKIKYPLDGKMFVDDQLTSYSLIALAQKVLYSDRPLVNHVIRENSDSHNSGFYTRLFQTYRFLYADFDLRKIKSDLMLKSELCLALDSAKFKKNKKMVYETSNKIKHIRPNRKLFSCKTLVLSFVLAHFPFIFWSFYKLH